VGTLVVGTVAHRALKMGTMCHRAHLELAWMLTRAVARGCAWRNTSADRGGIIET
jgi:hypothetical protein